MGAEGRPRERCPSALPTARPSGLPSGYLKARQGTAPTAKQYNLITGYMKGTSPKITRCHVANDVEQLAKNAAY